MIESVRFENFKVLRDVELREHLPARFTSRG